MMIASSTLWLSAEAELKLAFYTSHEFYRVSLSPGLHTLELSRDPDAHVVASASPHFWPYTVEGAEE